MILVFLLILLIGYSLLIVIKQYLTYNKTKHIPGPVPLPFLGNALEIGTDNKEVLENFQRLTRKYGSIVRTCIGPQSGIILTNPNYIGQALIAAQAYHKGEIYDSAKILLGEGLVTSSGTKWARDRKLLNTAFSNKHLEKYVASFNKLANDLVDQINQRIHLDYTDVTDLAKAFTLRTVCKTCMNIDVMEKKQYQKASLKLLSLFIKRFTTPHHKFDFIYRFTDDYRKTVECVSIMNDFVNDVMKNEKQKESNDSENGRTLSILDQLFRLQKKDALTDEEMREQMHTFISAGSETTGSLLGFAIYELAKYPGIQEKILEEVESVLGTDMKADISYENMHELVYLERVIKELLRKYPTVPLITRVIPRDIYLDNYHIPAETVVMIPIYVLHRLAELYPDPEKFDPDRFLPENCDDRNTYSFMPFAAGARNCIGQKFAVLEIKMALAKIIRTFRIFEYPGHKLKLSLEGTLASANGLPVIIKPRKSTL